MKKSLIQNGFELLKKQGYKKTFVEEIAKASGIAKGTFYNFFPSKEYFFYELIISMRDENREVMKLFFNDNPVLTKEVIVKFLKMKYLERKSIYDYFTTEELASIFRKLPKEKKITSENSMELAKEIIAKTQNRNKELRPGVVVNMMDVIAMTVSNKDMLIKEDITATVELLAEGLADYILRS